MDRDIANDRYESRSAAIEEALVLWSRRNQDSDVEEYYAGLTDDEQSENDDWNEFAWDAFVETQRMANSRAADSQTPYRVSKTKKQSR